MWYVFVTMDGRSIRGCRNIGDFLYNVIIVCIRNSYVVIFLFKIRFMDKFKVSEM